MWDSFGSLLVADRLLERMVRKGIPVDAIRLKAHVDRVSSEFLTSAPR